ncbi:MAG TPA: hypothetical protein VJ801_09225 [Polyangia bacterium]|nr:hypothetical protein [Polyangia bacterium]
MQPLGRNGPETSAPASARVGRRAGCYLNTGDSYNRSDGTYAYLYQLTGKPMLVDTSFGASRASDSWTTAGVTNLNQRIAEGVIAANVTSPPSDYQTRISTLEPQLSSTCR